MFVELRFKKYHGSHGYHGSIGSIPIENIRAIREIRGLLQFANTKKTNRLAECYSTAANRFSSLFLISGANQSWLARYYSPQGVGAAGGAAAGLLVAAFFLGDFLAVDFLAVAFFFGDFLDLADDFLAAFFLGDFFAVFLAAFFLAIVLAPSVVAPPTLQFGLSPGALTCGERHSQKRKINLARPYSTRLAGCIH